MRFGARKQMQSRLQCIKSSNCLGDTLMNFVCDSCYPGERAGLEHHSCVCRGVCPLAVIVLCASFHRHIVPPIQIKALNIISAEEDG